MASNTVPDDAVHADQSTSSLLFSGQTLWFAHTVPQRSYLIHNAKLNGATVVDLDKQADIRLVDHVRKGNPSGTYSYRYVERSIQNGKLESLEDHAIGMSTKTSRPVGSTIIPAKSSRKPFTNEDDQLLWDWIKPFQDRGGAWKGNEIYRTLESHYPHHTYQSWRDRWIKTTQFQTRQISAAVPDIPSLPKPPTRAAVPSQSIPSKRPYHVPISHNNPFQTAASQAPSSSRPLAQLATQVHETHGHDKDLYRATAKVLSPPTPTQDASQRSSPGLDTVACSNCYTKDSDKWQMNKRGELLCHDCAVFLRIHKVPRPSTAAFFQEAADVQVAKSNHPADSSKLDVAASPARQSVEHPIVSSTPNATSISSPSQRGHIEQRSPSFRPESPTSDRRPQTNEGRKRSVGRLSQSQLPSQESSNAGEGLEPENALEQKLDHLDKWMSLKKPLEKPSESAQAPTQDTASSASSKGKGPARRPRDEPGQQPSISPPEKPNQAFSFPASVDGAGARRSPEPLFSSNFPSRAARKTVPRSSIRPVKSQSRASVDESDENSQVLPYSGSGPTKTTSTPKGNDSSLHHNEASLSSSSSSSSKSTSHRKSELFETGPETANEYETATEGEAEEVQQTRQRGHRRLSTQALFDPPISSDEDVLLGLDIPEPEGGWASILGDGFALEEDQATDMDTEKENKPPRKRIKHRGKRKEVVNDRGDDHLMADDALGHDNNRADSTVSNHLPLPESIIEIYSDTDDQLLPKTTSPPPKPQLSTWLAEQKALYADIPSLSLSPILFKAIESTSFDFSLATTVVADMLSTIHRSKRATLAVDVDIPLPKNLAGVWTPEDDDMLMSTQTRDTALVMAKHGRQNCNLRFEFLNELSEDT
ncbi:hypothetical protein PV10_07631 [Exophiala mesophila]|uniref:DNA-binding protein RAP1 n=1 Tax=Exophiala mesophila TaxID=212818 RepID=A0A0D1XQD1_EXOME|nr:uncharacterized protein PV10_07631 [Exophiala mesophila]KIV90316.1 hypothetical protein PV10_07631 [Exophiala mesophila]